MANEALSGFAFLLGLLGGDATLASYLSTGPTGAAAIFRNVAPTGTAPDWLILGHQSEADTTTATGVRILTGNLYRVVVVGPESDAANLKLAADRVDALLMPGGSPLRNATAGGVTIKAVYREQVLVLSEEVQGAASGPAWLNVVGLYRLVN